MVIKSSKLEDEIFERIKEVVPDLGRQLNLGSYFYDYYKGKKLIEFNGDYWHGNPEIYEAFDVVESSFGKGGQYACDLWARDEKKKLYANNLGYEVLVIWESEYKSYPSLTIQKCIDFLN